jgi:hypothetical protein
LALFSKVHSSEPLEYCPEEHEAHWLVVTPDFSWPAGQLKDCSTVGEAVGDTVGGV